MADEFSFADEYESFGDDLVPKALPDGTYRLLLKKCVSTTTGSGKPTFKLTWEVQGGPQKGKTMQDQMTWSPESVQASQIFARQMGIFGATPEWIKANKATGQDIADKIQGIVIEANVKEDEPFNGLPRNKIYPNKLIGKGSASKAAAAVAVADDDTDGAEEIAEEAPKAAPKAKAKAPAKPVAEEPAEEAAKPDDDSGEVALADDGGSLWDED